MKALIPTTSIYHVRLPDAETMREHLEDSLLKPIGPHEAASHGFVDVVTDEMTDLVVEFTGGYAFALKTETRRIPASTLKTEFERVCREIEDNQGYKPGKKQRREIKEDVQHTLIGQMPVQHFTTICFYDKQRNFLYVPTTSATRTGVVTHMLIRALSAIEFTSVVVDGRVHGLTERLSNWLDDDFEAFGDFQPTDHVTLQSGTSLLRIKRPSLDSSRQAIVEAVEGGFSVKEIGLSDHAVSLTLTNDFKLKSIKHLDIVNDGDPEGWQQQVELEILVLRDIVDRLIAMIGPVGGTTGDPADGL